MVASLRQNSSNEWVVNLLYGATMAPRFGIQQEASSVDEEESQHRARALYCKALLHASSGGRLARDWLAGCSSLLFPSGSLLSIAMKHEGSEQDVERYRDYLVGKLQKEVERKEGGGATEGYKVDVSAHLSSMPEVRCFVYDAIRALVFYRHKKVPYEEKCHLFSVAAKLGLDQKITTELWGLVEQESSIARDKQRALENPWNE
ncbi:hypothetical protein ERJ75_000743200 [Trypanosoma vivax]|uniref:Uncharacterized protein n=1 Tax=Trypanosoma vivax (strain Y486) TaxID=1055687 RepID=G0TYR8_TRYVY|nr:hypothetical protein ERJ75_000743200 [Trypanosoma vivax]CCC49117.1 conserved hypothetical protein [Trypanosoma vivax Y486]